MHSSGLFSLTFNGLEVVQTTLASHLTLELLEFVEGHAGGISSEGRSQKGWAPFERAHTRMSRRFRRSQRDRILPGLDQWLRPEGELQRAR